MPRITRSFIKLLAEMTGHTTPDGRNSEGPLGSSALRIGEGMSAEPPGRREAPSKQADRSRA